MAADLIVPLIEQISGAFFVQEFLWVFYQPAKPATPRSPSRPKDGSAAIVQMAADVLGRGLERTSQHSLPARSVA
jgi:hypothetical protein